MRALFKRAKAKAKAKSSASRATPCSSGARRRHQGRAPRAALDLGAPWTRRRDEGSARRGAGTDASSFFVSTGGAVEKPRNPSAHFAGKACKAGTRGCPFFGLLFFGHAKKSDSAVGRRTKRPPRRRAIWRQRINKHRRHWIPAFAGTTSKKSTSTSQPKAVSAKR
jgi:hypothetical protein